EDLKGVLRTKCHHRKHLVDELLRYVLVEQVTHAVGEHHAGFAPAQRIDQLVLYQPDLSRPSRATRRHLGETVVRLSWTTKAGGDALRITIAATLGYTSAAPERIPRGVGPFDLALVAQLHHLRVKHPTYP